MKALALNVDGDSDEEDSDYEYTGGDMALYDSKLDQLDEINHLKGVLNNIQQGDGNFYNRIMAGI